MSGDKQRPGPSRRQVVTGAGVAGAGLLASPAGAAMALTGTSIAGGRTYTRAHFLYYAGVVTPGTYR